MRLSTGILAAVLAAAIGFGAVSANAALVYPLTLPFVDDFPDSDIRNHADYTDGERTWQVTSINSSNPSSVTVPSSPGSEARFRIGYNDEGANQHAYMRLQRSFDIQGNNMLVEVRGMSMDLFDGLAESAIQLQMNVVSERNVSQKSSDDGFGIFIQDGVVSYGGRINDDSGNKYNGINAGSSDIDFFPTGIDILITSDGKNIQYTFYETESDPDPAIISYSWDLDADTDWGDGTYTGSAFVVFDINVGASNTTSQYAEVWMDSVGVSPEPATAGLLIAGLTGLVLRRSRRRR